MKFDPYRFPTPKHGARYGGEGNQVGMIGPPRKYKKRKAKASAPIIVKAKAVPAPVKRAAKRIRHKTRPLSAVTKPLLGLGKPRKPRAKKM
jgi:hypothetical protein